jgi:hypothetical protein
MIEEGVITGVDARPGTAGRDGQAGRARVLRRPAATDLPRTRIGHQAPAGPCGWPCGARHAVSGDGLRLAPPHRHRAHARSAAGHRYRSRRARAGSPSACPPCHADRAAASRSPRSPPASRPADRTLMPESPLTSNTRHHRTGVPAGHRICERPAGRVRLARPATVRPGSPPPSAHRPSRGRTGCTPGSAAAVEPPAGCPGSPSVAVRGKADGAHRPSWRPGRCPLTCIVAVTASGSAVARLRFAGVFHCAPLH